VFALERDDARDGPENLLARDSRRVVDVVENRRLDKESGVEPGAGRAAAAGGDFRLGLADLLIPTDAIELLAADERPHLRLAVEPGADSAGARLGGHRVDELVVNRTLDQNPAPGSTDLALVEKDAEPRAL